MTRPTENSIENTNFLIHRLNPHLRNPHHHNATAQPAQLTSIRLRECILRNGVAQMGSYLPYVANYCRHESIYAGLGYVKARCTQLSLPYRYLETWQCCLAQTTTSSCGRQESKEAQEGIPIPTN